MSAIPLQAITKFRSANRSRRGHLERTEVKLGLKSALLRLLTAVGLPQAILPKLIKETRFALRQDWERESRNLAKRLDTSLIKSAKQADKRAKQGDKTLAAGLRDIKEQIRSFDDRLGDLERRAEATTCAKPVSRRSSFWTKVRNPGSSRSSTWSELHNT